METGSFLYSPDLGGFKLKNQKISLRVDSSMLQVLFEKYGTKKVSEAVRMAITESVLTDSGDKLKTLFPYVGKKPLKIGKVVVEAFKQSGCNVFVDLFCGSAAMLCYLPLDTKVVINDIDGCLTNLYMVIRDNPCDFVSELAGLPYSEVLFHEFNNKLKSASDMTRLERAVAYYYVRFSAYWGKLSSPVFHVSTKKDVNCAEAYQKNLECILQLSKRLQRVEILNRDFRKVLRNFNNEEAFVYADCPYLGTESYYENVFKEKDHQDLAAMLKSHQGKFVLSSKAKRELRKLYRSNQHYVLEFGETKRTPDKRHREQLIMNFEMKDVKIKPYR